MKLEEKLAKKLWEHRGRRKIDPTPWEKVSTMVVASILLEAEAILPIVEAEIKEAVETERVKCLKDISDICGTRTSEEIATR